MDGAAIVAIVAAILGPLGAYLVAARKLSGKIATSEAASLWEEAAKMRSEYRDEIERRDTRLRELEDRITKLEQVNADLLRVNADLLKVNADLLVEVAGLRSNAGGT